MANNISLSEILHTRPAVVPTIYGYILPEVKSHEGYIKIGYTDRDVETRIKEQLHTAAVGFKAFRSSTRGRTETSGSAARFRMRWRRSKSCARRRGSRDNALGISQCAMSKKQPLR